jgi:hypothetical protein
MLETNLHLRHLCELWDVTTPLHPKLQEHTLRQQKDTWSYDILETLAFDSLQEILTSYPSIVIGALLAYTTPNSTFQKNLHAVISGFYSSLPIDKLHQLNQAIARTKNRFRDFPNLEELWIDYRDRNTITFYLDALANQLHSFLQIHETPQTKAALLKKLPLSNEKELLFKIEEEYQKEIQHFPKPEKFLNKITQLKIQKILTDHTTPANGIPETIKALKPYSEALKKLHIDVHSYALFLDDFFHASP